MNRFNVEIAVGLFVILGIASLAYLAIKLGDLNFGQNKTYEVSARFKSTSGLKDGAVIEVAGVRVGKVARIELDPNQYDSVVKLAIDQTVRLQEDSIASIRTSGIIGDKFVNIAPGGSEKFLASGGEITETESSINLEELVSKYIFQKE